MITIDGSMGEGGGQVLRTSLALSLVTGQPVRLENVRAGRRTPGLLRQHLTAVNAAAEVGGAEVEGAALGSTELEFRPGPVRPGEYAFAVGTAGSATLVLQTVLPPLLLAPGPSRLTLEGGTHNPLAPPFDFLERSFLPVVNRMGPRVSASLERHGFYPAGGGRFSVEVEPAAKLVPIELADRGEVVRRRALAAVANLPFSIAQRELAVVEKELGWTGDELRGEAVMGSRGPGNVLFLEIACEHVTEVVVGFGERGVSAVAVASRAATEARRYLNAGVAVGEHLADQLMLPFALAGGGAYTTIPLSRHSTTNIEVIEAFLGPTFTVEELGRGQRRVAVLRH